MVQEDLHSVGDYRLLKKLGEGAAGDVYLSTPTTNKPFAAKGDQLAVKLYKPEILREENQFQRIKREFTVGSTVSHPNVVAIHEVITEGCERPFLVMEYVEGMTLDRWVEMFHPIPDGLLLDILLQLIDGIGALHEADIIHRDIKPQNIMISSTFTPKIMDLGVVRITKDSKITPSDKFVGTIRNSSPELLYGEEYDQRTDLYSFGTVLYQLLHRRQVFADVNQFAQLVGHVRNKSPDFDESLATESLLRGHLLRLAKNLVQKDPAKRPKSWGEVEQQLQSKEYGEVLEGLQPLNAYIAAALTGPSDDARYAIHFASATIAEICKKFQIFAHQPRKQTDPILHKDINARAVYELDRQRVSGADLILAICTKPSFGVGQELEIAASLGIPTLLITARGTAISRMVTGGFLNLIDDPIEYATPEELEDKLFRSLSSKVDLLRSRQKNILSVVGKDLGPVLSSLREAKGLTIPEAAKKLGISDSLLEAVEKKPDVYHNLGVQVLKRTASLYGQPLINFLSGTTARPVVGEEIEEDRSILELKRLALTLNWSYRDLLELSEKHSQVRAARGGTGVKSEDDWLREYSELQKQRLDKARQLELFGDEKSQ